MSYSKAIPMPAWAQERFAPQWRKWLEVWKETGFFEGTDCGSPPTKFALQMMGFSDTEISDIYPVLKHSFITVRFDNETSLNDIQKKLENLKFKWLITGYGRLEVFSSDGVTHNHHVHILSTWCVKTRIIRDLQRYFKVDREKIDVKQSDDVELYDKRNNYLNGIKQDKKSVAMEADTKYLQEHNIKQVYSWENI